jgi:hypothetical protein
VKPAKIPINFQLDDKVIDGAVIKPATFSSFADCISEAHRMTQPAAFSARLLRVRMSKQVNYHIVRSHEFAVLPAAAADRRCCVAPAAEEGDTRRMARTD